MLPVSNTGAENPQVDVLDNSVQANEYSCAEGDLGGHAPNHLRRGVKLATVSAPKTLATAFCVNLAVLRVSRIRLPNVFIFSVPCSLLTGRARRRPRIYRFRGFPLSDRTRSGFSGL